MNPIIIIGAGLAGYQLARELHKHNPTTELVLITADDGHFYPKPQLSTALTNQKSYETLVTASASTMASQLNAIIRTQSTVTAIHPENNCISIGDEILQYDKLILACGADMIKAPLEGNGVKDVLSINHLYHYTSFQELIKNKKTIAILGAGLIGCEFANDLSNAHYKTHIISPAKAPLDLLIPFEIGKILQEALEINGAQFHLNCIATRIDKVGDHYTVELSNGNELEVDFVLSAIGLKPHIKLAQSAGIKTNYGVVVNRFLETSIPNIYALGDCAEVEGHVLPYIAPILNCARALSKTLLGEKTQVDYPPMPVIVKTPAYPIAVCPPPKNMTGIWEISADNHDTRALFYNEKQELYGFVLTNNAVKDRNQLIKQLPNLF